MLSSAQEQLQRAEHEARETRRKAARVAFAITEHAMSEARQMREGAAREVEERRKVAALDVAQVWGGWVRVRVREP